MRGSLTAIESHCYYRFKCDPKNAQLFVAWLQRTTGNQTGVFE